VSTTPLTVGNALHLPFPLLCWNAVEQAVPQSDILHASFAKLGVAGDIHGRLPKNGLLKPTAAQAAAIPTILKNANKDVTVFAETGTFCHLFCAGWNPATISQVVFRFRGAERLIVIVFRDPRGR
jgi:hypothetical protein